MNFLRSCLMFGQWMSLYCVLLVLAMEFGLIAGPRTNFSAAALWWILPAAIPVLIALILNVAILMSSWNVRGHYLLHLIPYMSLVTAALIPTLYWGWKFEFTLSYLLLQLGFAASIDMLEYVPRIHYAVRSQPQ